MLTACHITMKKIASGLKKMSRVSICCSVLFFVVPLLCMLRYAMLVVRSVVGKVWPVPFTCYCLSLMCLFMLSIHCLVSQSFSLAWDRTDAAQIE